MPSIYLFILTYFQILEILNEKTFCDVVQETQSGNINVFEKLRTSICHASDSQRKEFFLQLKNHLNVKNIVQTVKHIVILD